MLLPLSVRECLPADHFCFTLDEVVNNLNLSAIKDSYKENGSPAYHPALLIKILFYAYSQGIRSSRKIETNLYENNAFRFLAANEHLDHGTINLFRKIHLNKITDIFAQIVVITGTLGMADLSDISIDGTKYKANASKKYLVDKGELRKLKIKINEALNEANQTDKEEDEKYGDNRGYNQIPEEMRDRQKRTREIKKLTEELGELEVAEREIDRKQEEAKDNDAKKCVNCLTSNITDKDSALMQMKDKSYKMAFNAQLATSNQVITAFEITNQCDDGDSLKSMIQKSEENTKVKIDTVKSDPAYFTEENIDSLNEQQIDGYIPDRQKRNDEKEEDGDESISKKYIRKHFKYDESTDTVICPDGKLLKFKKKAESGVKVYVGTECSNCPNKDKCTKGKARYFKYNLKLEKQKKIMRAKLNSEEGKKKYMERLSEIEPVFGNIKQNMKFDGFSCRGKEMARIELCLVSTAHNLIKIFHHLKKQREAWAAYKGTLQ
jgi:transposase